MEKTHRTKSEKFIAKTKKSPSKKARRKHGKQEWIGHVETGPFREYDWLQNAADRMDRKREKRIDHYEEIAKRVLRIWGKGCPISLKVLTPIIKRSIQLEVEKETAMIDRMMRQLFTMDDLIGRIENATTNDELIDKELDRYMNKEELTERKRRRTTGSRS